MKGSSGSVWVVRFHDRLRGASFVLHWNVMEVRVESAKSWMVCVKSQMEDYSKDGEGPQITTSVGEQKLPGRILEV